MTGYTVRKTASAISWCYGYSKTLNAFLQSVMLRPLKYSCTVRFPTAVWIKGINKKRQDTNRRYRFRFILKPSGSHPQSQTFFHSTSRTAGACFQVDSTTIVPQTSNRSELKFVENRKKRKIFTFSVSKRNEPKIWKRVDGKTFYKTYKSSR